jgi:hypothetical protein
VAAVDGQLNDCLRQNPRGINCECANIQECNRAPPCIKTRASRNHSAPSNAPGERRPTENNPRGCRKNLCCGPSALGKDRARCLTARFPILPTEPCMRR